MLISSENEICIASITQAQKLQKGTFYNSKEFKNINSIIGIKNLIEITIEEIFQKIKVKGIDMSTNREQSGK